ncbi:hypothetical protein EW145_g2826 [Phellinidium pouzarii]|uniref:Monothiol glutaredoxin-5, mitochondrial n=1 Tax=Phellinidium pouzarii TaxID=167371 RepID=A0A4S4LAX8_9AGAM|nr:hypothetical protein EW145_g2826 [Phellinidium pouzarii]
MFRQAFRSSLSTSLRAAPSNHTAFTRFLSQQTRSKLEQAVKEYPLVLFMKGTPKEPMCGFSRAVIQLLDINGVPPEKMRTYDVLEDNELRNGIKEFSQWPTIPQVFVDGEFVGGCDIILSMHQSGELEKLLVQHTIIPKAEDEFSESPQSL